MKGPLAGMRVVELGTYVAAPALGSFLGMLGAEVVKVEPPAGDPTRRLTPWSWVNYNWNKESVVLDLKSEGGISAIRRMLKGSDIFVESLSPRAVKELGLQFSKIRRINPKIVYCSIKGFASDSSSSQRVGFDTIAQAEGGLMYVAKSEGGRPSRVGNPCVDLTAATFGAIGVLSALLAKPRRAAFVEVPLYDVVVYWNGYWLPYIDINGVEPSQLGSSHPAFSPYGVFTTADGFIFIGVLADPQWQKLTARLNLASPPRFSKMSERIAAREEVNSQVQAAVGRRTNSELLNLLGEDVPCARVSSLMDVYRDAELRMRKVVRTVRHEGRSVSVALPPVGGSRRFRTMTDPPPLGSARAGPSSRSRKSA
ncbi:MAG: CoA transferase [Nitrososphaerales archaeon]|nr:CoA transferase [Nitrososphaerales archaeon]